MTLTYNYQDLQNIKEKLIHDNIKDEKRIYILVSSYEDTLSFMYKNKLIRNISKGELEKELEDFKKDLLQNTNKSYSELENLYKSGRNIITSNDIKLKK